MILHSITESGATYTENGGPSRVNGNIRRRETYSGAGRLTGLSQLSGSQWFRAPLEFSARHHTLVPIT